MGIRPVEITVGITPRSRFDIVEVSSKISELHGDLLQNYKMTACCSFHTTAGYLEQELYAKLGPHTQLGSQGIDVTVHAVLGIIVQSFHGRGKIPDHWSIIGHGVKDLEPNVLDLYCFRDNLCQIPVTQPQAVQPGVFRDPWLFVSPWDPAYSQAND